MTSYHHPPMAAPTQSHKTTFTILLPSWLIFILILGFLCMEECECDTSSDEIYVKLSNTPKPISNLHSPTFAFHHSSSCTNCSTSTCKLDDLLPLDCSSGEVSYANLQDGKHTFEVCTNGSSQLHCANYNWTIDTVPPTATVTTPTSFTNALNVSVYISFTEPCSGGGGGGGFRCLSANDCSLIVYGAGQVIPSTLTTIKPNLEYSISVNLSSAIEYGRVVLVTDKGFCRDAAGNQFTRTTGSSFFLHFDRRDVYVDLRTHIPEQLLQLDNTVRSVQATNKYKNLKLYLYFTEPIVNTSAEVLKSIQVSQGSLISATSNNDSLGNRRFGFQLVDLSETAIVTARLDSGLLLTRQGTPVSPVAPVTFLFDSQRPYVRLSTTSHMKTQQEHIPVTIKFMKPVFGFDSSQLSISGGHMKGFREISKSVYSLEIQPTEDMVVVHVPENATTDVAGNKNLASNPLRILHFSVPVASLVLSCSATAAFVLTAVVATLLTISTASLQNYGAFATPSSPLLTSNPARIIFRIVCHIQIFALSGWLAVPLPIEYSDFVKGLRWSIPYFRLPWETDYVKTVWPMNPHAYGSKTDDRGIHNAELKNTILEKPDSVYGLPLTAMEYKSFFENQNMVPEAAEYITDPSDADGWRDFNRSMFWLAVISGGLIILHILFLLILKLRKKKEKENTYNSVIFPRLEIFLVILAVPCVSAASAALLKGGSASGIAVGVLLLGTVIFLILALFLFLSIGISFGKLLQYKEVHHEDQKMHWYQALVKVTLGPGKRGQWTWINPPNSKWLTILGPLFEDLRGPPKYMLSQIAGGMDYTRGSIIASDDENEDAEAPFVQKVFGILRIYYVFLESIKRVTLGILVGTFSRSGDTETPTKTLLCVTSFQLFFMVLKKPFIKKKVQLVEIISVSSQLAIFVICLVLLRKNLDTRDQTKIGIAMICLFLFPFVVQILTEWNALISQIKQLDPDNKSLCLGLKIASWGILLLFVPIKLMKNVESRFPLKGRRSEDATASSVSGGRFRSSDGPERPWMKQLRDLAKASFSRDGSGSGSGDGGTPSDPSSSRVKWSGFLNGKRSGSSSQAASMDSKSQPKTKAMYKDFEAIFGKK